MGCAIHYMIRDAQEVNLDLACNYRTSPLSPPFTKSITTTNNTAQIIMRRHYDPTILSTAILLISQQLLANAFVVVDPTARRPSHEVKDRISSSSPTRLAAATGISLGDFPAAPREEPSAAREGNNVGVLFLNLGGPTTGEDVEGKRQQIMVHSQVLGKV
jgi:hypothetical protein